jgi:hypothetical protein
MSTTHSREASPYVLPEITRQDRAWFVKEARRRRNEELDKLFSAFGRAVVRFTRALVPSLTRTRWHAS